MYLSRWMVDREDFIVEENNVATHPVRTAFGGKSAQFDECPPTRVPTCPI